MDALKRFFDNIKQWYLALPSLQRLLLTALVGTGLLALVFLLFINSQSDMAVLFTNLTQEDGAAIISKLKGKKVPYQLEAGGSTIMVPRSEVYELRLLLASEGIPRGGGVGFELFDRQNLGVTDFVQRLNYQRALQGELARTIVGMPEIAEARVHIVTPKESLFVEDQQKATASVAIRLHPGRTISPMQIDGIANLVASAVPGLHPRQVTILDLSGKILSKPQDALGSEGLSAGQMSFQRQMEERLEHKVQSLLDQVVGSGKSFARISAELDFRKIDVREEIFTPNREAVRSEQKTMERSSRGAEPGGNPETNFNLNRGTVTAPPPGKGPPPLTPPTPSQMTTGGGMERQSELKNYEINRELRQLVDQPGKIKRLSVAVVVDGVYKGRGQTFAPRSADEMRQLTSLAKKAVGFDAERGDQLEISCVPLASKIPEGAVALSPVGGWQETLMSSAKIGVMVLLFLGLLMFLLKRRPTQARPTLLEGPPGSVLPPSREAERVLAMEGAEPGQIPVQIKATQPVLTLPDAVQGQEKVAQLIAAYPDRAVEVIRLWLHDKTAK